MAFLVVAPGEVHAQGNATWQFQGVEVTESIGCVNSPVTTATHGWILYNENFNQAQAEFRAEMKKEYGPKTDIRFFNSAANFPRMIALVRLKVECGRSPARLVDSYRFFSAKDQADVIKKVESHKASYNVTSYEIAEWIDAQATARLLTSQLAPKSAADALTDRERDSELMQAVGARVKDYIINTSGGKTHVKDTRRVGGVRG